MSKLLKLCLLPLLLAACASPQIAPPKDCNCPAAPVKPEPLSARYTPVDWAALPAWPGDQLNASWTAWQQSCLRVKNKPEFSQVCAATNELNTPSNAQIQQYFEQYFSPWRISSSQGAEQGLITGYYEPLLFGSRQAKTGSTPLYRVPDDLLTIDLSALYPELKNKRVRGRLVGNKVVPYWNRSEIEAGQAPGSVLVWADDAIEAFFLQIQGSGRIQLEDGSLMRVNYADQNGHPYRSIGKWLIDQGELQASQASMQGIMAWAKANPSKLTTLLNSNPSYVFFREHKTAQGGPTGALGAPLVDGASVAIDPRFVPLGSPLYLATTYPNNPTPLQRLVHAQDTGGAIAGPIRADFFWGFGAKAGELAGRMKQQGQVWILWPKGLALPAGGANGAPTSP